MTMQQILYSVDRTWGRIDLVVVNRPSLPEYLEFMAIAKPGHEPGPVAFKDAEVRRVWESVKRYHELRDGHAEANRGELDEVLMPRTRASAKGSW